jgi:hypothetical protein
MAREPKPEQDKDIREQLRRDPEFEMPDPDQVKKDIEQAEKVYREDEDRGKKSA